MFLEIFYGALKIKKQSFFQARRKKKQDVRAQRIYRTLNTAVGSASVRYLHKIFVVYFSILS